MISPTQAGNEEEEAVRARDFSTATVLLVLGVFDSWLCFSPVMVMLLLRPVLRSRSSLLPKFGMA
jgi:hypothetical protein